MHTLVALILAGIIGCFSGFVLDAPAYAAFSLGVITYFMMLMMYFLRLLLVVNVKRK